MSVMIAVWSCDSSGTDYRSPGAGRFSAIDAKPFPYHHLLGECVDCGGCKSQPVPGHGQEMDEGAPNYVFEEKLTFLDLP